MTEPVSTATATIRLPMSASAGATGEWAPAGTIRIVAADRPAESSGSCCGGACCAG